ncbi:hypothetical protein CIW49_26935 [Mycolicibacterium sp. P1-18]|uniref:hypothetical protein n=1 Tax=Mycolicibacterium sp. P1-18 TaxID=2024615 RepID=UPI0011F1094E|nr:hypothetical protein [Mycolicibacterium sp. P1-18]KAA0093679.1 hypothetical protein CIW49_26935 [Mycolicibacterium sp. P1-18]
MIDYTRFPGLSDVYLEDSYVLAIVETPGRVTFRLEAVLIPEHPAYRDPPAGQHHCYAVGDLIFADVTHVDWVRRSDRRFVDASGETDLGNVDVLRIDGNVIVLEGDWGELRLTGGRPRFKLDA